MDNQEYHNLLRLEENHWFYSGKREIAEYFALNTILQNKSMRHADIGACSGIYVKQSLKHFSSFGIEFSDEAIKNKVTSNIIRGDILSLPLKNNTFDYVSALDIVEHVEDDKKAINELIRITKTNGIIIINVPAFMFLWSKWDEKLHHKRRYTKRTIKQIIDFNKIDIIEIFYINNLLFFPILFYRIIKKFFKKDTVQLENKLPPLMLNSFLKTIFVISAKLKGLYLPFGVSLFIVLRKKKN